MLHSKPRYEGTSLRNNKDKDLLKKKLNKLGTKFAEGGRKMKSLERMLRKCKGSK